MATDEKQCCQKCFGKNDPNFLENDHFSDHPVKIQNDLLSDQLLTDFRQNSFTFSRNCGSNVEFLVKTDLFQSKIIFYIFPIVFQILLIIFLTFEEKSNIYNNY